MQKLTQSEMSAIRESLTGGFRDEFKKRVNDLNDALGFDFIFQDGEVTQSYRNVVPTMFDPVIVGMLKIATYRSYSAGMSGAYDDGGARSTVMELVALIQGIRMMSQHRLLDRYKEIAEVEAIKADPEYTKYLELHARFGKYNKA